ncbi:hypothetical protein, partial [Pseudomonas aeruginosa]|nr:hypothetical protein [Pseudomonas aeruginosa]
MRCRRRRPNRPRLRVESARAFARHELAPKAADWDRDHHF